MQSLTPAVLVVGAGPTGLTAALQLARYGIAVRIIDSNQSRTEQSRALAVQPRTLEIFQDFGIVDAALAAGQLVDHFTIHLRAKPVLQIPVNQPNDENPYPAPLILAQSQTERLLEERLATFGIHVERQTKLIEFQQRDHRVYVTLTRAEQPSESFTVNFLIGADGAHSTVRHGLNLPFLGAAYLHRFWLADATVTGLPNPHHFGLHFSSQGTLACFPLQGDQYYRLIFIPPEKVANPATLELSQLANLAQQITRLPLVLSNPTWITDFRLHHRGVPHYQVGSVFVAGDAAHIHSPAGGQGMNTGIQDAYNLTWKMALVLRQQAPLDLLTSYNEERHPVGQLLLHHTDRLFRFAANNSLLAQGLRCLLLPLIGKFVQRSPQLQHKFSHFASQLGIRYEPSTWIQQLGATAEPRAGKRAPNSPLIDCRTQQTITLFERFVGIQFHLLIFLHELQPNDQVINQFHQLIASNYNELIALHIISNENTELFTHPIEIWYDHTGHCQQSYGVSSPSMILIRPDGYIGFRSDNLDLSCLTRYLTTLFIKT